MKNKAVPLSAILILVLQIAARAGGDVDLTFNPSAYGQFNAGAGAVNVLPGGKFLIGGGFTEVNGYSANSVARLNSDGTVDTGFNAPGFYGSFGIGTPVYTMTVQPDGKILVGGIIYGVSDATPGTGIRRINPDGTLDATFNVTVLDGSRIVHDIALQPDGKILVGGRFFVLGATIRRNLIRLNADGTLDTSFNPGGSVVDGTIVKDIKVSGDGKVLAVGSLTDDVTPVMVRLNTDGTVDGTFSVTQTGNGSINAVELLGDGRLIIGGNYTTLGGTAQDRISRVNTNGSLDLGFNPAGGPDAVVSDIEIRTDGKIFISGAFTTFNAAPMRSVARLFSDGTLDTSFTNNEALLNLNVADIELLPDNSIVGATGFVSQVNTSLVRIGADGGIDPAFRVRPTSGGIVRKVIQQPDGKVLAAGTFLYAHQVSRKSLVRFNADGSLDTGFVPFFNNLPAPPVLTSIALQPDGKILIGTLNGMVLVRLNPDGSQDTSFTTPLLGSSAVHDITVQTDGRIVAAGTLQTSTQTFRIHRLQSNGSIDVTFTPAVPNHIVYRALIQTDGKYLICGEFQQVDGIERGRIARLNANGTHDTTFVPPGGANSSVSDMDLQADGKIVIGGWFTSLNGNPNVISVGRLNPDGSLDGSFVPRANASALAVKIQPDGKILIGGQFSTVNQSFRNGIARLNPSGTVDLGFAPSANTAVYDVQLQSDGKVLLGGQFTRVSGVSRPRVARLLNSFAPPRVLFDYDGDQRSDVSVFRPSENKWYVFRSSDAVVTQQVFAVSGDVPVPADYDGDGKTDIAIFRPSLGDWWYLSSLNGNQVFAHWGTSGDVPRPSDFDGDGKADFIVYRPSNNFWYRISGNTGIASNVQFGLSGDKPVVGDFDGDGKYDPAIFRPSTGTWWYLSSVNGAQIAAQFGISTDVPSPADFDGDGKTDFAVYRPSNGVWYILNSSNGQATIVAFGLAEDKPVAADYDGDGRADIAVFRPSTGVWYLLRSASGFTAMQFGVSTDTPTQNSFVP